MAINKKDRELYKKYSPKLAETLKLPNNEKTSEVNVKSSAPLLLGHRLVVA